MAASKKWMGMLSGMIAVAYLSVFGISVSAPAPLTSISGLSPQEASYEQEWKGSKRQEESDTNAARPQVLPVTGKVEHTNGVPYLAPAFGYNKKRNVDRWEVIYTSMRADAATEPFSVVDYGADEGYFSISTAFAFPQATVVAIDMGGVGGSIWKKGDYDVLKIQEAKIEDYGVAPRVVICQTAAKPEHFFALDREGTGHDYQFVLSVFHWFTMKDRREFEEVIVRLFRNAKTTFIELPIAGDYSERFMKQVGSQYFTKWYDGRSDIAQIIRESLASQGAAGVVKKIGSVKWLPGDKKKGERDWDREVFRVDLEGHTPQPFDCHAHFTIYGCAPETKPASVAYSKCADAD